MSKETSQIESAPDCFEGKLTSDNVINKEMLAS
jgi:hypothetical protein